MLHFWVLYSSFFFFNDTATTEIYTLSLHDALPIWRDPARVETAMISVHDRSRSVRPNRVRRHPDRKSTRLNSSHVKISYAVFCLKKKKIARGDGLFKRDGGIDASRYRPPHPDDALHFFFFNDTATTEIYTLSLHDALPIPSAVTSSAGTLEPGAAATRPRSVSP